MRDSHEADGRVMHRLKLIQRAHQKREKGSQILPVTIPMSAVVDFDLGSYKLELKNDFNIERFICNATRSIKDDSIAMHFVNTTLLADVAAKLAHHHAEAIEAGTESGAVEKLMG